MMILNNYKLGSTINSNSIYEWINATDRHGIPVVLQIAQPSLANDEINSLFEYFEELHSVKSSKGFIVPEVAGDDKHRLVLTYSEWDGHSLSESIKKDPSKSLKYWEKIADDFLHKLHQKNLLHGFLTLDSLVVIGDQVKIRNFGYAPLLKEHYQAAIDICSAALAPAYINKKEFSNLTDIYAFAQMVISCHPELKSTQWYKRSTSENSSDRFTKIRESFSDLSKAWEDLYADKTTSESPLPPKSTDNGSWLIPKYTLTVTVEPKEGGTVEGSGSFKEGEKVTIKASANSGWKLDRWSGDSPSSVSNKTLAIVIKDNLKITAHFVSLLPEEVKPVGVRKKTTEPKSKVKVSFNKVKWATVSVILLAVMGGGYTLSPNISPICKLLGNCQEYTDTLGKAEAEAQNSEKAIKNYKNIEELKIASDRLESSIALTKTIPQNAIIYNDIQKAILKYQTNLGELTSLLSKETKTQVALKEADKLIQQSKQIVKSPTIENLNQAIKVQEKALQNLTAIPTTPIYTTKSRETLIQESKKQIQLNTDLRNRLVEEKEKRPIILWGPGSETPISRSLNEDTPPPEPIYVDPPPSVAPPQPQQIDPPLWGPGSEPPSNSGNKPPLW